MGKTGGERCAGCRALCLMGDQKRTGVELGWPAETLAAVLLPLTLAW